ncbi:hypothetical protein RAMDARK_1271 [Rickettsia amblyommatis str. Darkwater]|uniref:Uncharacterized protein n=1 Tax=Rickettsia amblyommatis str. Ac/Pa TaxID=1359164 RepID=A0A0F3N6X0_RICAM|nr:hypothetical protein APHACPA_1693 [Rickettsia amblyommatis str. Ac/Pa]KJV90789.1 hypothetical protein RAMDARK_1271 [Rickettsia amblyommatis str. Darkwater]
MSFLRKQESKKIAIQNYVFDEINIIKKQVFICLTGFPLPRE